MKLKITGNQLVDRSRKEIKIYNTLPYSYILSNHWHFLVLPKAKASSGKWALPSSATLLAQFPILQNQFSQQLKKIVIKGCNKTIQCITVQDTYLQVYKLSV